MNDIVKFSFLFIICAVLLTIVSTYVASIFDLFGASLNYISTGSVGSVLNSIIGYVGWFLDLLFINQAINYVTYFGSIQVGSISWALTFFRVTFGLIVFVILLKLIFDR